MADRTGIIVAVGGGVQAIATRVGVVLPTVVWIVLIQTNQNPQS
jgi:hypothetical protein